MNQYNKIKNLQGWIGQMSPADLRKMSQEAPIFLDIHILLLANYASLCGRLNILQELGQNEMSHFWPKLYLKAEVERQLAQKGQTNILEWWHQFYKSGRGPVGSTLGGMTFCWAIDGQNEATINWYIANNYCGSNYREMLASSAFSGNVKLFLDIIKILEAEQGKIAYAYIVTDAIFYTILPAEAKPSGPLSPGDLAHILEKMPMLLAWSKLIHDQGGTLRDMGSQCQMAGRESIHALMMILHYETILAAAEISAEPRSQFSHIGQNAEELSRELAGKASRDFAQSILSNAINELLADKDDDDGQLDNLLAAYHYTNSFMGQSGRGELSLDIKWHLVSELLARDHINKLNWLREVINTVFRGNADVMRRFAQEFCAKKHLSPRALYFAEIHNIISADELKRQNSQFWPIYTGFRADEFIFN